MTGRGGGGCRGGRVQRKDAREEWPDLVDVILSWSLKDVMNEGLFKDKVGTTIDFLDQFVAAPGRRQCQGLASCICNLCSS
jgi:hypothetical protein